MTMTSFDAGTSELRPRAIAASVSIYIVVIGFVVALALECTSLVSSNKALSSNMVDLVGGVAFLAYFVSAIPVGMWIYRAHAGLVHAGVKGLEFSPGWSVGWFFVPIMSLFKPYAAMKELWNGSHYSSEHLRDDVPPMLKGWWGSFLLGNFLANIGTRFDSPNVANVASSALMIASAVILLRIIERVGRAQSMHDMSGTFA